MVTNKNDSFNPKKRQVNRRVKRLTGLKRKNINKLRKIERKQRKTFNRTINMMPGESRINGNFSLDRGASMLSKRVENKTKSLELKMKKIKFL